MNNLSCAGVSPRSLVLNLTLQCPLRCSHCCYRSDMSLLGRLDAQDARQAIDQAARIPDIREINFVGGDPFLATDLMREALTHAQPLGFTGSATTSAFWARNESRALAILKPLVSAGLGELVISYDDAHAEFVPLKNIKAAVQAARALQLRIYVAVTVDADSTIDAAGLRRELDIVEGHPLEKVYEVAIDSTGRAADGDKGGDAVPDQPRRNDDRVYRGACQSVLQNIQVTHDGKILPCCGVLPHNDRMVIGHLARGDRVDEATARAYQDPLWVWIALEGPVELLCQVTRDTDTPLHPEDFDGICSACQRLFSTPELLDGARRMLRRKQASLNLHVGLLAELGLWHAPTVGDAGVVPAGREPKLLPLELIP